MLSLVLYVLMKQNRILQHSDSGLRKEYTMKQILKKPQSKERLWDLAFGALLVIALVLWGWLNLHEQHVNDHDSAKVLYHTVRMWEEKTLLIPGWKYMTTAEWDCSALPALMFYGLTGDILLSFALSNIIHVVCFTLIVFKLLRGLGLQFRYACIPVLAILLPLELGMLSYANMLFYGAAQYIYKVLLPIWLLELLTAFGDGSKIRPARILEILAFGALTFLTAASSGLYVFLCGLFPLIACTAVFILRSEQIWQHIAKLFICAEAVIATLGGYVLQKILGLSTYADQMNIVLLEDFFPKLAANFTDLLRLARALPTESISLYTPGGIMYVVRFAFLVCVLFLGLQGLKGWLHERGMRIEDGQSGMLVYAGAALGTIFVWNLFIQQITVSTARYHLIGYVPLMIAAGITFAAVTKRQPPFVRFFHFACAAAALSMMMLGCWNAAFSSAGNRHNVYHNVLAEIAREQGADSVVFVNDSAAAEMARVFDPDRVYVSYFSSNRSLTNYDAYDYFDDRSALTNRHLMVATQMGGPNDLPDYLQADYKQIGDVFGDPVYLAEVCYLDGIAGPMPHRTAVDYPFTHGYSFDAAMLERGVFPKGETRTAFQSPWFDHQPSAVRVTLHYQLADGGEGAWIDLMIDGKAAQRIDLPTENQLLEIEIPAGRAFAFSVGVCQSTELYVDQITFDSL